MIPTINGVMLAISSSLAAAIAIKVTVTTALGLIAVWLARGDRAAVRHALLAATFSVMLLLPMVSVVMPPLHVGVPVRAESRAALLPLVIGVAADRSVPTVGAGSRVTPAAPQESKLSLSNLLLAGWAAGVALFLLPVVVGLWQIRSLRRSGLPWRRGQSVVEALALDAGIHRRVEVLLHEALPGPMTCGVLRPAIVLPRDAENWNQEDLNRAVVHELEHVRRGDSVSRCLARAACAVYWFHPLVWMAWRRLVLEAERSCDDAVLGGSEATAYADQLVGLAKRLSVAQRSPLLAMANRTDLATRVGAVLDSRQRRGRAGTLSIAIACGATVGLVIAMSPINLVAAPQAPPTPRWEVVSIRPCEDPGPPAPGVRGGGMSVTPGRLHIRCFSVGTMVNAAYVNFGGLNPTTAVSGGPAWIHSDQYDIEAKAEGNPGAVTMEGPMLQALLEDRFKLKIRRETKEVPVYDLTVAKGGFKLQPMKEGSCITFDFLNAQTNAQNDLKATIADIERSCGRGGFAPLSTNLTRTAEFHGMTLDMVARRLSVAASGLGRPVINKTGIEGMFDFQFEFSPDEVAGAPGDAPSDPSGAPSIFTAIQNTAGLKLEPAKGPGTSLFIDSIQRPSEN